jgi:hypothetical protein
MKSTTLLGMLVLIILSCNDGHKKPDISQIKVQLTVRRFEKDLFTMDTLRLENSLLNLYKDYPLFLTDFIHNILGLQTDDSVLLNVGIKKFIHDYKQIFDSTRNIELAIEKEKDEIIEGLRYVKFYFPTYQLPKEFITYIGPIDAIFTGPTGSHSEVITTDALCSGLQLHLGVNSTLYTSAAGQQLYPAYISNRFTTEYISVNSMKNIVDDIFPSNNKSNNFLEVLVDQGKRMYLLDLFMPDKSEEIKLGYTSVQLKGLKENEALIWNYFTENSLLYETDMLKIRPFISDGPYTSEFGEGSPGFISLYIGKQLVTKYMNTHPETKPNSLLELTATKILAGSKYKPR